MRAMSLLTLDKGSVLLNPRQMPREIVLKHVHGALIKIERTETMDWKTKHREELEVNFAEDGKYASSLVATATLADRQAFGFRLNGEAINPMVVDGSEEAETIEIEPLTLGCIVVESPRQLPFAIYTTDEVYYRAYLAEDEKDEDNRYTSQTAVVERRRGPQGGWTKLGRTEPPEAGYLVEDIAEDAGMVAVNGGVDQVREAIEEAELFPASRTEEDDKVREQFAIQDETAFGPTVPKPRAVEFPE